MDQALEQRRLAMRLAIESVISHNFIFEDNAKVRRGVLQNVISDRLGVIQSAYLGRMVMQILQEIGVRPIIQDGYPYYKGLQLVD